MSSIKGIIFDYGGTIDTPARHWSEIIWDGYRKTTLGIDKSEYLKAYVYAERELAKVPHIKAEDTFRVLLYKKVQIQFSHLKELKALTLSGEYSNEIEIIVEFCDNYVRETIKNNTPLLDSLRAQYPMVIVSNFYGNLNAVLDDYGLRDYFKAVVESAVVGVRKPSPQIFALGVEALGMQPSDVVVIGDSYKKDIAPAVEVGCKAIWFKGASWQGSEDAIEYGYIIKSWQQLPKMLLEI